MNGYPCPCERCRSLAPVSYYGTAVDWNEPFYYQSFQAPAPKNLPREPLSKRVPQRPPVGAPEPVMHAVAMRSRPRRPPARTRTCSGMARVMVPS